MCKFLHSNGTMMHAAIYIKSCMLLQCVICTICAEPVDIGIVHIGIVHIGIVLPSEKCLMGRI